VPKWFHGTHPWWIQVWGHNSDYAHVFHMHPHYGFVTRLNTVSHFAFLICFSLVHFLGFPIFPTHRFIVFDDRDLNMMTTAARMVILYDYMYINSSMCDPFRKDCKTISSYLNLEGLSDAHYLCRRPLRTTRWLKGSRNRNHLFLSLSCKYVGTELDAELDT
jgi:hypothetical protein